MLRIIPRIIGPITVYQVVSPIDQCWIHRRDDTQMNSATRKSCQFHQDEEELLPILVISLILLFLEASQGRQCFFEIGSMPHGHRGGTNKIRTDPPIVAVHTNFFWSDVVLVRQFVHLTTYFFTATQFNHVLAESLSSRMNWS